jgi:citrate synthase
MLTIGEVMTAPAITALAEEPLVDAIARMHDHRVGSVVVVKDRVPVGIVTERDVLGVADSGRLGQLRVCDVMTAPAESIEESFGVTRALEVMRERGFRHMPVVGHEELLGVVSLRDLARLATIGPAEVPRGLKGVVVADTEVGDVRGTEGFYHYRQHSAVDLATSRPLEDVWRLLVDGSLPRVPAERAAFANEVRALRTIPPSVLAVLPEVAAACSPLEGLRTTLSFAAAERPCRPLYDLGAPERRADALFVAAVTPTLLTALHRLGAGRRVVPPRDDLGYGANYLWMLTGAEPPPDQARSLEQYLISTVDHGFNASTFTARVIASTGADMGACICGAVGALSGPLHGGAPSRALELVSEIERPERARAVVERKVEAGERIMGFGHPVYRTADPRSRMLREVALRLGGPLTALAVDVERTVEAVLAERKPGRELHTNVEFYAGVVMAACGVPPDMFTPTFASSRVIGWSANVLEQAKDPKIIRPIARYVGPPPPQPVPPIEG